MNFGKKINELRRTKNITQDELAAELGVTAAAVSKWENGYTLPDILMLCALADYFDVTTDELLGRAKKIKYAVIFADTVELGERIKKMAAQNHFIAKNIFTTYKEALACAMADTTLQILVGSKNRLTQEDEDATPEGTHILVSRGKNDTDIMEGFEFIFRHYDEIPKK